MNIFRKTENQFFIPTVANILLFALGSFAFTVFLFFFDASNLLVIEAEFLFSALVLEILYLWLIQKNKLSELQFIPRIEYMFAKYILIQELLVSAGIAFLIGVYPILQNYANTFLSTRLDIYRIAFVWLSCVSIAEKLILQYTRDLMKMEENTRTKEQYNSKHNGQ